MPNQSETGSMGNAPKSKAARPAAVRILLALLRWSIFPILCVVCLYIGLRIGYERMGGGNPGDVLRLETWRHMLDLVFKDV